MEILQPNQCKLLQFFLIDTHPPKSHCSIGIGNKQKFNYYNVVQYGLYHKKQSIVHADFLDIVFTTVKVSTSTNLKIPAAFLRLVWTSFASSIVTLQAIQHSLITMTSCRYNSTTNQDCREHTCTWH